ncbi:MAG: hypothetical protein M3256_13520 [Actinomycetota bacterium]|nr:hypothetical protein [Actinomycetota bacterium]
MQTSDALMTIATIRDQLNLLESQLIDDDTWIQVPRQGPWRRAMLHQLWPGVSHLPGVQALFATTSSAPNGVVAFSEIVRASGLEPRQQANEHARLSRVTHDLFKRKTWPIENWQHADGEMRYRMGATIAGWWRELVSADVRH